MSADGKIHEMPSPESKKDQHDASKGRSLGRCLEFPARSGSGTTESPRKPIDPPLRVNGPQKTIPKNRRNDKHDPSPAELLLIRAGHHAWRLRKQALRKNDVDDVQALDAALDSIWAAKRLVRAELREKREQEADRIRAHFAKLKAS